MKRKGKMGKGREKIPFWNMTKLHLGPWENYRKRQSEINESISTILFAQKQVQSSFVILWNLEERMRRVGEEKKIKKILSRLISTKKKKKLLNCAGVKTKR